MPRIARKALGGLVYHMLNRAAGRTTLFHHGGNYLALLRSFADVRPGFPGVRLLACCLMPNHGSIELAEGRKKVSGSNEV